MQGGYCGLPTRAGRARRLLPSTRTGQRRRLCYLHCELYGALVMFAYLARSEQFPNEALFGIRLRFRPFLKQLTVFQQLLLDGARMKRTQDLNVPI
jgi:hypothetical protein